MNTVAASPPRVSRTGPLAWVLLAQAAALVSLVPWTLVAGFSFLSFDRGVAESALLPAPLLFALWAYPLLPLACAAATWRAWRRGDVPRAVRWSGVELLAAVVVLAFVWFVASPVG
jgi:hypothetical protein